MIRQHSSASKRLKQPVPMAYPIPTNREELLTLCRQPADSEILATAIVGIIQWARTQGQSLADLQAEILTEDQLLEPEQRQWLSELLLKTWQQLETTSATHSAESS
uniref:Uncharacterized protein SEM0032 n=2 Tax=Synechococcus elongatus TaxID=32046 RepID=Q8GJK9_SYNE7|nr:unknown protein [Synechococcus elongatus PCC 7942 = FACHB-805]